jgi:hypothetical protein
MHRIKTSVSGDLTMIRLLIPLSPANRLCNTIFYHLLRCHPGKFCIFLVLLIIARKSAVSDCQELYCTHEEADTRMILHAIHAEKTFGPRMTSQEMIKDSVAQSIRLEILSMLVCW